MAIRPENTLARASRAVLVALLLVARPTSAESGPAPSASAAAAAVEAPVKIQDTTVFVIRAPRGGLTAEQRAKAASEGLRTAMKTAAPSDVRVERRADAAVVYAGATPIVNVVEDDARLAGDATIDDRAAAIAASVRDAMQKEQKRSAIANTVLSVSLVVFLGLVAIYLLRKAAEFSARARAFLAGRPDRIPAIRIKSLEVVGRGAIESALDVTLLVGRWVVQIGLAYAYLVVVLSLFEGTRGYTERLTGFVLAPLSQLAGRLAGALPILVIAAVAAVAVIVLVRFAGAFFESFARGHATASWMPRDLARPTGVLVRVAIVAAALVFAAPLVTGDPEGSLARAGTVVLVVIGLGSTPLVAAALVGASVVFLRRVRVGDVVDIGGHVGRVTDVGLLEATLAGPHGSEIRVPHLLALVRATRVVGAVQHVEIEVEVSTGAPLVEIRACLLEAAASVGGHPSVELSSASGGTARWRVGVASSSADATARLFDATLAALPGEKITALRSASVDAA